MEKSKEKKNGKSLLKKIAIFLYILAFICLIVGIFQIASHVTTETKHVFESIEDFDDFDNFDDYTFSASKIESAISSIFSAVVLFVWGSVFMVISNSKQLKQKIEQKRAEQEEQFRMRQEAQQQEIKQEPKKRYFCAYCDNELDENDKKCPYCGASKKIQK